MAIIIIIIAGTYLRRSLDASDNENERTVPLIWSVTMPMVKNWESYIDHISISANIYVVGSKSSFCSSFMGTSKEFLKTGFGGKSTDVLGFFIHSPKGD